MIIPSAIDLYQAEYVPLIEELISDESLKVKEAIVSNIKPVVLLIGPERFEKALQELATELSTQGGWRTRKSALNAMTLMRFPPDHVASVTTLLLKDEVSSIMTGWAGTTFWPRILHISYFTYVDLLQSDRILIPTPTVLRTEVARRCPHP